MKGSGKASDLGIQKVERKSTKILLVPKGGWKNMREKTTTISLPRVSILEDDDSPPAAKRRR